MKFPQLDKLFEESMERSIGRGRPAGDPYGLNPLASDHFLLRRSWDYFKARVRMIEEQWKKIMDGKDIQINTLKTELKEARTRAAELEDENHMLKAFEQNFRRSRIDDYSGFARKNEGLRMRWDEEREVLQRKVDSLEFQAGKAKKEFEVRAAAALQRDLKLKEEILALKKDASLFAEREKEAQRRWAEEMAQQGDAIQSLENKVDILKGEVDRRDQMIKHLKEVVSSQEKDERAMTQYSSELQHVIREKDRELGHLKTRLDILRQEKDTMRAAWQREQAEWRELWDRGRETWERKK